MILLPLIVRRAPAEICKSEREFAIRGHQSGQHLLLNGFPKTFQKRRLNRLPKKSIKDQSQSANYAYGIKMAFENANEVYVLCTNKLRNRAIDLNNNSPK